MTQAQKGTFLQLPSVFIETCDLPETAQIMYIRMLHNFGYKGAYTGSLRKLANLVRMSKSTVDRMLDVLTRSHLISRGMTSASETAQSILHISLDPEYLWNANIDYCTTQSVPNWDSTKEGEVSQDGTKCPKLGRTVPVAGQTVPTRTLKRGTNITKTSKITKDTSLVVSASAESDGVQSFLSSLSSFEETLQEVHNGKAPRDVSSSWGEEGCIHEEPLKAADTSKEPACTSAAYDTTHNEETLQEKPTQVVLVPTIQDAPAKPVPTRETHEQDELKIRRKIKECSPEIQARRRKWQVYFNQRRGGELLPLKGDRINESNAIASLVDAYTDAQIQAIDDQLFTVDKYWSDRERRHDIGGHIVWKKSTSVREVLKERFKWPGQVITPQEEPKVVTWTPVMRITPPKGVTVIYG